jgi:hypothetical protein
MAFPQNRDGKLEFVVFISAALAYESRTHWQRREVHVERSETSSCARVRKEIAETLRSLILRLAQDGYCVGYGKKRIFMPSL